MSPSVKKWLGLFVTSLALAIIIIDTTVLNVSLKTLVHDLHTDLQQLQWVITSYALVLSALTITGGRLGDLFGRKKMFVAGALLFGVGSLIASFSTSVTMLLIGWSIIEGIGAALMMPATASLVVSTFHGRERAIAFGVWGGVAGASSAIGPIIGGYLTSNVSWHWAFRINVIVVLLVVLGSMVIKESIDKKEKPQLDWWGVILSSLGMTAAVYGIIESSTYGWWKAKQALELFGHTFALGGLSITPFAIVLGLAILGLFGWWELQRQKQGKTPLITLAIFKNSAFTSSVLTMAVLSMGMSGLFFSLPVFMQAVRELDAFHTGIALLPLSLAVLVGAPLSSVLSRKIASKYIIQIGIALATAATLIMYRALNLDTTAWQLAPGLALFGLGMGFMMAQISNMTLSAVDVNFAGEASGINNTMRQVGQTLGSALLGAIFLSVTISTLTSGVTQSATLPEPVKQVIVQKIQEDPSSFEFGSNDDNSSNVPKPIQDEIKQIAKEATVDGSKRTLLYTTLFTALSLIASINLPKEVRHSEAPIASGH